MKIIKVNKLNEGLRLNEELGLNNGVYNIATRFMQSYLMTITSNAEKIYNDLMKKGVYSTYVNHRLTKGYFNSQMQVNWIDCELKISVGDANYLTASFDPDSEDPTIFVSIDASAKGLNRVGLEYIHKLTNHEPLIERLRTAIVHELTHVKEYTKRHSEELPSSIYLQKSTSNLESNPNDISGFKEDIGKLAYFSNESEINARVAECAILVKNFPPNQSNEDLLARLKDTMPWQEMLFLLNVDFVDRRNQFKKVAQDKFGNSTPESVNSVVSEFIKETLTNISGQDNSFMRLLRNIASGQFKGDALSAIEAEVKQRGLYFKNKLYKTIGLAIKQHKLHTAINSRG
jgi:hypothetical protein